MVIKKACKILGIDPGVARVGWGLIEVCGGNLKPLAYGCIETAAHENHLERLKQIKDKLEKILDKFQPDQVAIEKLYFAQNVTTALTVGEARGVILYTIISKGLNCCEFTPLEIKQAICGYGRASKDQIQKMVMGILKLKEIPKPDDAADGLAIAITASQTKF
ncbi:MAG: crossover junction endodeoxyribonuclease RuvC [Patescibacteria group bacterium]